MFSLRRQLDAEPTLSFVVELAYCIIVCEKMGLENMKVKRLENQSIALPCAVEGGQYSPLPSVVLEALQLSSGAASVRAPSGRTMGGDSGKAGARPC